MTTCKLASVLILIYGSNDELDNHVKSLDPISFKKLNRRTDPGLLTYTEMDRRTDPGLLTYTEMNRRTDPGLLTYIEMNGFNYFC